MTLSLIIPSRNRPELLRNALIGFRETDIEIIVIANSCPDTYAVALEEGADIVIQNPRPVNPVISVNKGLKLAKGEMLMGGSDDLQPQEGWLSSALEAHQEQLDGYGMVCLNDLMHDGNSVDIEVGLVMFDRRFCIDHLGGCLVVPHYHHLFADKEAILRAKRVNKFHWCQGAIVKHLHSANKTRSPDSLDTQRVTWWKIDEAIFLQREAMGFPDDFEPVIV